MVGIWDGLFQGRTLSLRESTPKILQGLIFSDCWNSKWRKKLLREGFKNQPLFIVRYEDELVVEPTRLKHVWTSNWINSPGFRGENKKCVKPPTSQTDLAVGFGDPSACESCGRVLSGLLLGRPQNLLLQQQHVWTWPILKGGVPKLLGKFEFI